MGFIRCSGLQGSFALKGGFTMEAGIGDMVPFANMSCFYGEYALSAN